MHEQSETLQRPQGFVNVYGGTQFPLPKEFGFEKNYYPSVNQATSAAAWRSRMGGGPEEYPGAPRYGFSQSPQPQTQQQVPQAPASIMSAAEQIQRMNMLLDMRRGR